MNTPSTRVTLEALYEEYTLARRIELTRDQFTTLATFFPALLIISTDGRVDEEEWDYVENLTNNFCDTFGKHGLSQQEIIDLKKLLVREVRYLQGNFDTWERKFTKALKTHLAQHLDSRASVLDSIHRSAALSEGVTDKESIMVEYLLKELGME